MLWKGIAHNAYVVSDMEASFDFYINKLGFTHAFSLAHPKTGKPWIEYLKVADGQFIELFYPEEGVPAGGSYLHLCLETPDCVATVNELRARGTVIDVEPNQGSDFNIQAWVHDPDGNKIEIMQISPESPQANS